MSGDQTVGSITIAPDLSPSQWAELAVLAGVLWKNDVLDEITLDDADFENPLWADTYGLMRQLHSEGKPITAIGLGSIWPKHQVFFFEITSHVSISDAMAAEHYAEQVREAATRRRLEAAGFEVSRLAKRGDVALSTVEDTARKMVDEACGVQQGRIELSHEIAASVVANIGRSVKALPTPWGGLTRIIRGFRGGALYLLAARPALGKSALALQMARGLEKFGHVLFFTLEMGREEVATRLIAQETQVPLPVIEGLSPMQPHMQAKIDQWQAGYEGRIIFDDTASITMAEIRSRARTVARTMPLSAIVIDYLQLVGGMKPGEDLRVHVTNLSREAKLLARDFDVPVIALSQLNRNSEHRADKRPAMSDLRESGSLEQDADVVMLLHRHEDQQLLELIVAKQRQGPTLSTDLMWHGEFTLALD